MIAKAFLFTSPSCGTCKVIQPLIVEEATEAGVSLEIVESDNTEMFTYWQVTSIPTLLLVASLGYELKRFVGTKPNKDIKDFFNK